MSEEYIRGPATSDGDVFRANLSEHDSSHTASAKVMNATHDRLIRDAPPGTFSSGRNSVGTRIMTVVMLVLAALAFWAALR